MSLIIDTDPAIGIPFKDIDDGLAILLALANAEVEGLTINHGNVETSKGIEVAKKVLNVANRSEIPVFKGAEKEEDIGKKTEASEFIVKSVKENPGEISILAIAPLTNIATAILSYEDLLKDLKELVIMGGSLDFWPMSFFGEFNFRASPRAASIVLSQDREKSVVSMDVCSQVMITSDELDKLGSFDSEVSSYIVDNSSLWLNLNKLVTFEGFYPWDLVACVYYLDKSLFEVEECDLSIQVDGLRKGRISKEEGDRVILPKSIDGEGFLDFFLSSIREI